MADINEPRAELSSLRQYRHVTSVHERARDQDQYREQLRSALTADSAYIVGLGLEAIAEQRDPNSTHVSMLKDHPPKFADWTCTEDFLAERIGRATEMARHEPATIGVTHSSALDLDLDSYEERVCPLFGTIAAREPAVLKPLVPQTITEAADSAGFQWVLSRLYAAEPALVRRHIANSYWTIEQDLQNMELPTTAVSSLSVLANIDPDWIPDYSVVEQLVDHHDDELRQAAATTLVGWMASPYTTADAAPFDLDPWIALEMEFLDADDGSVRKRAARHLGIIATKSNADQNVVDPLVGHVADDIPAVREEIVSSITEIVDCNAALRSQATVERLAVLIDSGCDTDTRTAALAAVRAHGETAVHAIGLDPIAVLIGEEKTLQKHAVETLLDLGMCAPTRREEIFRNLRWSQYATSREARETAVEAIGECGRCWPSVTPEAVDALLDHLALYPDDAGSVADALTSVCQEYPAAASSIADQLQENAESGDIEPGPVMNCLRTLSAYDSSCVQTQVDWVVEHVQADGAESQAAARTLLTVARTTTGRVADHLDALHSVCDENSVPPGTWAITAEILAVVAYRNESQMPPVEWLCKRFPDDPEAIGPSLARLVEHTPAKALPPLEGLLSTTQRFGSDIDLDVEHVLDDVIDPLIGSHPVAGIPVVETLCVLLENKNPDTDQLRRNAAQTLRRAIESWPYLAPLAEDVLLSYLDDGDVFILQTLARVLPYLSRPEAEKARSELLEHRESLVRTVTREVTDREQQLGPSIEELQGRQPGTVDASGVDKIARCLAEDTKREAAIRSLVHVATQRPELLSRVTTILVAVSTVTEESDLKESVLAAITDLTADESATELPSPTADDSRESTLRSQLFELATTADPLIGAQSISCLGIAARNSQESVAPGVLSALQGDCLDKDSHLVQSRALVTLRRLACDAPQAGSLEQLEPFLYRPHALVPQALWAAGTVVQCQPASAETVAESISGLLEWSLLDRVNATATLLQFLEADPTLDSLYAPLVLDRLAEHTELASRQLVHQVGMLSGEAIVGTSGGVDALLTYLDESEENQERVVIADRLFRCATVEPQTVIDALAERERYPRLCMDDALYLLSALEALVTYDGSRLELPYVDAVELFSPKKASSIAGNHEVRRTNIEALNHPLDECRSVGVRILAAAGHEQFDVCLNGFDSESIDVTPSPTEFVTFLRECDSDDAVTATLETLGEVAPQEYIRSVTEHLLEGTAARPRHQRQRTLTALSELCKNVQSETLTSQIVTHVDEELDAAWEIRLTALDTVAEFATAGLLPNNEVVQKLLESVDDTYPAVRKRAATNVARVAVQTVLDIEQFVEQLESIATDHSRAAIAREGVALTLGELAVEEPSIRERSLSIIAQTVEESDSMPMQQIAETLIRVAETDSRAVIPGLSALASRFDDVSKSAQFGIIDVARITATDPDTSRDVLKEACSVLFRGFEVRYPSVESHGLGALASVAAQHPYAVCENIGDIQACLEDGNTDTRMAALSVLENLASREVLIESPEYLDDLCSALVTAISPGSDGTATSPRSGELQRRTLEVFVAIARTNPDTASRYRTEIRNRCDSTEPGVRRAVARCLSYVGTSDDRTRLQELENDPVVSVRSVASESLSRLEYRLSGSSGPKLGDDESRMFRYTRTHTGASRTTAIRSKPRLEWETSLEHEFVSSPVIVDEAVYVGNQPDELIYDLYYLDRSSGKVQTVHPVFSEDEGLGELFGDGGTPRVSTPAIGQESLYVSTVKIDSDESNELHQTSPYEFVAPPSTVVAAGSVFAGFERSICAFTAADMQQYWQFETDGQLYSSPAVAGNSVVVGSTDCSVYCVHFQRGTLQWQFNTGGPIESSPAIADGTVYIGSDDGSVFAIDLKTGTQKWRFETEDTVKSSPALVDSTVYIGSNDGYLYALNSESGTVQWKYDTGGTVMASPVVASDTVYVANCDGDITALDATEGTLLWELRGFSAPIVSAPTVVQGNVYLGDTDGTVYSLTER